MTINPINSTKVQDLNLQKKQKLEQNDTKNVSKPQIDFKTNTTQETPDAFSDWLNDKDKVCTDGKDDGKISFKEKIKSFGKGLAGVVKEAIKHPIRTVAVGAACAALIVATGGAAAPVLVAAGAAIGTAAIGYGALKAATAKTDGEAKQAYETIGNGTFTLATSALCAKSSLNTAAESGVATAQAPKNISTAKAVVQNFKAIPEAIKVAKQNTQGNLLTIKTGIIHPHSNKLKGADTFKDNITKETKAFKIMPKGTKIKTDKGIETIKTKDVVVINQNRSLSKTTAESLIMDEANGKISMGNKSFIKLFKRDNLAGREEWLTLAKIKLKNNKTEEGIAEYKSDIKYYKEMEATDKNLELALEELDL